MFDWDKVSVDVKLLCNDYEIARDTTIHGKGRMPYEAAIRARHSPIRAVKFRVEMVNIPTFVSVHFCRHTAGIEHWVKTNRDDRGGEDMGRWTPVNHTMHVNAETLLTLAEKRLCGAAHYATIEVMQQIVMGVIPRDPVLAKYMLPRCFWRGGLCDEPKPCKRWKQAQSVKVNPYLTKFVRP